MLTHDLKESILSLYVLTNKLQCNNDNLKIVLPKIKKQLRNSNEMINSIVELAKNESVIQIGSSEILNSIHLIHENYSDRMISKKVKLIIEEKETFEKLFNISEPIFESLLSKILANVIKFSHMDGLIHIVIYSSSIEI